VRCAHPVHETSCRPALRRDLVDVASETAHGSEIEAHLQRNQGPVWGFAVEDAHKIATQSTHVNMRKHGITTIADPRYELSGTDSVADLDLNVLNVNVADLHGGVRWVAKAFKQNRSGGIRASCPRPIYNLAPKYAAYDAIERRKKGLVPAEPVLVATSVAGVEAIELSTGTTVTAIGKAVSAERISCMILRSERMLRAGKGSRQWRMNNNGVDGRMGRWRLSRCPSGEAARQNHE
jgi:hypothetical protein